jgi:hypothetical protein
MPLLGKQPTHRSGVHLEEARRLGLRLAASCHHRDDLGPGRVSD